MVLKRENNREGKLEASAAAGVGRRKKSCASRARIQGSEKAQQCELADSHRRGAAERVQEQA